MSKINLESMSLEELQQLKKDVEKALKTFEERRQKEARQKLEEEARKLGFSLSDLVGGKPAKKGKSLPPKYRHPDDPSLTWTGRGRKPRWLVEEEEKGKSQDDFLIG